MCKLSYASILIVLLTIVSAAQVAPPATASATPALELTLQKAIQLALAPQGNMTVQLAGELVQMSRSHYQRERANLLPNFDGYVAEQNQTVSLRALGLRFSPGPGFTFPAEVGPFSTFDARMRLRLTLLDFSVLRQTQAFRKDLEVSRAAADSTREQVAGEVAKLYAAALRANADVETAQANVSLAQSLLDSAGRKESVGEATQIDVTRAQLQLARDRQHLLAANTAYTRARLDLLERLNLDWSTEIHVSGELGLAPAETYTSEAAVAVAHNLRADVREQEQRIASAQLRQSAAQMERVPSLGAYADYGVLSGVQTHLAALSLRIPLWDGGRREADQLESVSLLRQEEIKGKQLGNRIQLEVRKAQASLSSAQEQVRVADMAVTLAQDELAQAQRRFAAGVSGSIEVIDAETRLETARRDLVAARFGLTLADIDMAQATGTITKLSF